MATKKKKYELVNTMLKNSVRGLTIAQISEKLGVSRQRVHAIIGQTRAYRMGTKLDGNPGRPAYVYGYSNDYATSTGVN
jgi:transposase